MVFKNRIDLLALSASLAFIVIGSIVSLHRFWQFEVSYIDFGQYDQAIWKVSRLQEPIVHHFVHGKINVLGDHVTPSIFLISPLYWLTDRSEMILVVQAIAVGLSGLFLYDIGKHILKNKFLSFSILSCYFLFVGLQNAVITEFHELTVMTLPLMLTLWAMVKNKITLYFIFLILTLGFKETTFALGIGIGIALFLLNKDWRKYGLTTIMVSLIWGFIAFKIIIPYFSDQYLYATSFPDGFANKLYAFIDHPLKQKTLLYSFMSFSFLPFFAPQFWLVILQDYASRFLPLYFTTRWDLGMHYNAQSAILLALSSIFGMKHLLRLSFIKHNASLFSLLFIINSFILFRFVLHGPFLLAFNPAFYRHTTNFDFLEKAIHKIPSNSSIMTQNNLAPRFTHQDVQLVTPEYNLAKPEYILIDIREGQSPNNFLGTPNLDIQNVYQKLLHDNNYTIFYNTIEQFIFKRK